MSYNLLLNLASVANAESKEELWNYISSYNNALSPENSPALDQIAGYAINYYQDFVKPQKQYRIPTEFEKAVLNEISDGLPVNYINLSKKNLHFIWRFFYVSFL